MSVTPGDFEAALEMLRKRIGLINAEPLQPLFLQAYQVSQSPKHTHVCPPARVCVCGVCVGNVVLPARTAAHAVDGLSSAGKRHFEGEE